MIHFFDQATGRTLKFDETPVQKGAPLGNQNARKPGSTGPSDGNGTLHDSEGLPYPVSYTLKDSPQGKIHAYRITDTSGNVAGGAYLTYGSSSVDVVNVVESHRGKGIAKSLYDHIEHHLGVKLVPSAVTPDGKAFWFSRTKKALQSIARKPAQT